MGDYYFQNNRFYINGGEKPIFRLLNTTILDISDNQIRFKTKTLDKLIPVITDLQNKFQLENAFVLDKSGLSLRIEFINSVNLTELIDKRFHYNVEICLHSKSEKGLLFKILRIDKKDTVEVDYPEPDLEDINDIRENISTKVEAYKKKFCDLSRAKIKTMKLDELIALEENLCDFISRNL
jgi:hypothetical protein